MEHNGVRLIGVRLAEIPPLGPNHYLELPQGMSVLYGTNGAGKSRVLDAVRRGELVVHSPASTATEKGRQEDPPDFMNPWPQGAWLWSAGVRRPDDLFEWGMDFWPDRVAHDFDLGGYLVEQGSEWANWKSRIDHIQERFDRINDLPYDTITRRRLWEILLTSRPHGIDDEHVDLTIAALGDLAHQGLFSIKLADPLENTPTRATEVVHRVRSNDGPSLRRLYELGKQATADPENGGLQDLWEAGLGLLLGNALDAARDAEREDHQIPWWFGLPIHRFSVDRPFEPISVISEGGVDLPRATLDRMEDLAKLEDWVRWSSLNRGGRDGVPPGIKVLFTDMDGTARIQPLAFELATRLGDTANGYYRTLLQHAPDLRLALTDPAEWGYRDRVVWEARDRSDQWVNISQLSSGQRRWAEFAIQLTLASLKPEVPVLIILDEPEQGLHRRAERHLVQALAELTEQLKAVTVVATHSPAFLRTDLARLVHVNRADDGLVSLEIMPTELRDRIRDLGLDPADLLQLCRQIVLVEGEHDLIVFSELFSDEFNKAGAIVLPMRGAKGLKHLVDAQLLFDYTDVSILVVMDNDQTERVERIWNTACVVAASGDHFLEVLGELISGAQGGEGRYLHEFCSRAIKKGRYDRVAFQMTSAPDIVDYLPVSAFITPKRLRSAGVATWGELRSEYKELGLPPDVDFKSWLRRSYGASFTPERVRSAVQSLHSIHPDLTAVMTRVMAEGARNSR